MAIRGLLVTAVFLTASIAAQAALFSDDFDVDSSGNWNIITSSVDTSVTFAFDYSTIGVPPSPNGGGTTLGLRLAANIVSPTGTEAVTLSPVDQTFNGSYQLKFDVWVNANGPFPGGGAGSTEFFTAGIGHDDTTLNKGGTSGSGAWFAATGEGGSSRDYRAYKNAGEQFPESTQYFAGSVSGANNAGDPYYAGIGSIDVATAVPAQTALHPNQTGTTQTGAVGFAWLEVTVTVNGATALWEVDGLPIAELDPNIGSSFPLNGNISIGYMDIFTSISDNPEVSFGLIDNLVVLPDPSAAYLANTPTPADKAKLVSATAPLEWEDPIEITPIGYDVYLRKNDPNFTIDDRVVTDDLVNLYQPAEDELETEVKYYWRVDVHDPNDGGPIWREGNLWTFTTASPEPLIDEHPERVVTVPAGELAELSVVAINGDSYQWFKVNESGGLDTEVPGAISPTLSIASLLLTDEGYYYCVVKNNEDASVESDSGRILTKRKMAHWKFEDNLSDEVDPANDGTSPGTMTYPAGVDGQAAKIASPDEFIQIDNEIGLLNAVSISLWIKPTAAVLADSAILLVPQDGEPDYSILISSVGSEFSAEVRNSNVDTSVPGLTADEWNHLLLVYSPAERQAHYYLNGQLGATVTGVNPGALPYITALGIGARNPSDTVGIFEQGLIDDVLIYNHAISSLNAASLYTAFRPGESICLDDVKPQYDLNGDCIFNLADFAEMAATWLECNLVPDCIEPQIP